MSPLTSCLVAVSTSILCGAAFVHTSHGSATNTPYPTVTYSAVDTFKPSEANNLKRESANYISSCGPSSGWLPIDDNAFGENQMGYKTAVDRFCGFVAPRDDGTALLLPPGSYIRSNVMFTNETDQSGSRVMLTSNIPGYIEFEINNKQKEQLMVVEQDCKDYLMKIADESSECWGSRNKDTKGGTYQDGTADAGVSYHALPKRS